MQPTKRVWQWSRPAFVTLGIKKKKTQHKLSGGPYQARRTLLCTLLYVTQGHVDVLERVYGVAGGDVVLVVEAVGAITRSPHPRM